MQLFTSHILGFCQGHTQLGAGSPEPQVSSSVGSPCDLVARTTSLGAPSSPSCHLGDAPGPALLLAPHVLACAQTAETSLSKDTSF